MKSFSQFEEDIFIFDLFKKKNINNGLFVEFGAWDGVHLSNCKLLADNGWNGFFIEAEFNRYKSLLSNYQYKKNIKCINKYINSDYTLDNFITEEKITNIDVLSIDIDGKDLTELKRLTLIKPKTIIIECNFTIPLDTECEDLDGGNGSSYLSIKNFLNNKNYELIFVTYSNLIFIDKSFNKKEFRTLENQDIMNKLNPIRLGFNNFGEMFFIEGKKIVKKEYFRFPLMKNFITFQPVPKFLRNLTDTNGKGYKFLKIFYSNLIFLFLRPNLFLKRIFFKNNKK